MYARIAERGVRGQAGIVQRAGEALDEALSEIAHVPVAGVHAQDTRLVAAGARVPRRPTHHLRPVGRQPLDVLWMLIRV